VHCLFHRIASVFLLSVLYELAFLNCPAADGRIEAPKARDVAGVGSRLMTFMLAQDASPKSYDEALAVACLQGIINRGAPELYVLSKNNVRPQYWLDILSKDGRWLQDRLPRQVDMGGLISLAGPRLKGAVIWDPHVPATVNVATTIAGVEDGIVLSPGYAEWLLKRWPMKVIADLRGRFTGAETGSKKNDAYRWAIREYLARGRCSAHRLCLYEDSFVTREHGDIGYVITRDWAVSNRAFVFDLSPWGDEKPQDDPDQPLGLDLATFKRILSETLNCAGGKQMTELAGFFAFSKYSNMPGHQSKHEPVPTEWETVWLISPFNFYQNTIASDCFNQSFHCHAPRRALKQRWLAPKRPIENKAYVCFLMADYDSATPLYDFLPKHWADPSRGHFPLAWGINPNLLETYPDLIGYYYQTASSNDTFTADASAAGYMNPNRVQEEYLPLFIKHNQNFFRAADMDIAPMVLDWDQPSDAVKNAFRGFSPAGMATIVLDFHNRGGRLPLPHVWKSMPVTELINDTCNFSSTEQSADAMARAIRARGNHTPGFYLFRVVWVSPSQISDSLAVLRRKVPDLKIEVVDPHSFFRLFKEAQGEKRERAATELAPRDYAGY
jgi:GxGYxYP putative glycoside hydrolase C-terminal domain/GxGYxY sequence motif in domain of unknown function N-terminal